MSVWISVSNDSVKKATLSFYGKFVPVHVLEPFTTQYFKNSVA